MNRHSFGPDLASSLQEEIAQWFRQKGIDTLVREDRAKEAPYDYLAFLRDHSILSRTVGTNSDHAGNYGWDIKTIFDTSENLAFHGFMNWLMWHVTSLGVLPVWMSDNVKMKNYYNEALKWGMPSAYGMSEKAAGADWRNTVTTLTEGPETGISVLSGQKNYAGNAQFSPIITTFARDRRTDEGAYAFVRVAAGSAGYQKTKNAVSEQMYVCDFKLEDYLVEAKDIIQTGSQAFADAVNTINVGKVNLATAALGLHSRTVLETRKHLKSRALFGVPTSDFKQNQSNIATAALRSYLMTEFLERCQQEMESASASNQAYVLLNSVAKTWLTEMAERSIIELTDAASALTFEEDSPIYAIRKYVGYLPRLEGTKYINIMQSIKAAHSYFTDTAERGEDHGETPAGREYLLSSRPLGGFKKTSYGSWRSKIAQMPESPNGTILNAVVTSVAEWLTDPGLEGNLKTDERIIQAVGEVFFLAVGLCEISALGDGAPFADETRTLIGRDLWELIAKRQWELKAAGFPLEQALGLLVQLDTRFPEEKIIAHLDQDLERLAPSLAREPERSQPV